MRVPVYVVVPCLNPDNPDQPKPPVNPDHPDQPKPPVNPDKPDQPKPSVNPDKPDQPGLNKKAPGTLGKIDKTDKLNKTLQAGKISKGSSSVKSSPKTGDTFNIGIYLLILVSAVVALFIIFIIRKKKSR